MKNQTIKIAYLIAAHNNYLHLQRLIKALDAPYCNFYIHIDKKSVIPNIKGRNIFFISERINVHWSGFSLVRMTIELLKAAVKDNADYYVLLTGADYPIKPNSFLLNKLKEGGEYIQIRKMGEDPYAPLSRYKYYYFTDYYNRRNKNSYTTRFFLWLQNKLRKMRIKKSIPFQLYTGAHWFCLSKPCVMYILDEIKRDKTYINFFKSGFFPDESFFQTIIGNSEFYYNTKNNLTYADWSVNPGPAVLTETHIDILKNENEKFFARKFNDDSATIIDMIDKNLRHAQTKNFSNLIAQ